MNANNTAPVSSSSGTEQATSQQNNTTGKPSVQKEVFYSPAVEALIAVRQDLASISFTKSQKRLEAAKRLREDDELVAQENQMVHDLYQHSQDLVLNLSQFADDRPLTTVRYSPCNTLLASASFGPAVKVWNANSLECNFTYRGHIDRVTSIAWQPHAHEALATSSSNDSTGASSAPAAGSSSLVFASTSADGHVIVWDGRFALGQNGDTNSTDAHDGHNNGNSSSSAAMDVDEDSNLPVAPQSNGEAFAASRKQTYLHKIQVSESQAVASACAFHPHVPQLLGVACHDYSWRLYDITTAQELLLQDGHVKECSALGFHPDGSLVFTGDSGGVGLLWDLRSGQMIQGFQGHIKKISSVSFNPNGYQVATGSLDNTVKVWDLRKRKCFYTVPAHSNLVSDCSYSASGELLLTSSFDGTLKVFSSRDFRQLRSLAGHNGKVMSCEFANDERHIISAGYDRTIKLWAHKSEF